MTRSRPQLRSSRRSGCVGSGATVVLISEFGSMSLLCQQLNLIPRCPLIRHWNRVQRSPTRPPPASRWRGLRASMLPARLRSANFVQQSSGIQALTYLERDKTHSAIVRPPLAVTKRLRAQQVFHPDREILRAFGIDLCKIFRPKHSDPVPHTGFSIGQSRGTVEQRHEPHFKAVLFQRAPNTR